MDGVHGPLKGPVDQSGMDYGQKHVLLRLLELISEGVQWCTVNHCSWKLVPVFDCCDDCSYIMCTLIFALFIMCNLTIC